MSLGPSRTDFDPFVDRAPSRFVVGIDLGTTNSAVTFVDTHVTPWQIDVLLIPQLVAPSQIESRDTLPSFHYQGLSDEVEAGSFRLPWTNGTPSYAVGFHARDDGAKNPARLIASAKSWLCHSGVDRTADLLPWQGAADVERLSPVTVTARYLSHIRHAWNHRFRDDRLEDQDIVITLPASFDEVARELTLDAAHAAKLPRVVLIEEPQAAFYAWVYKHRDDWQTLVQPGDTILVCDIGGGTTDFTLIRVRAAESNAEERELQFHRVAVGEHLILGGDNLDLAVARHIEQQLSTDTSSPGIRLTPQQWDVLVRNCRRVKETLLSDPAPETQTILLPGSGARLLSGGLQTSVTRDSIRQILADGFLPFVALNEKPTRHVSGFREFGLPYASDPAITRHLAAFLSSHRELLRDGHATIDHDPARPDVVLFNGGFFASPILQQQLVDVLTSWFSDSDKVSSWRPRLLDNDRLDLAVARGAAYYGMVRRGEGVRIAANLARSYYIQIADDESSAICLVPGTAQPGDTINLSDRPFELTISQPVEFPLLVSSVRLTDKPGDIVPILPEQLSALPPIRTVLRTQSRNERGSVPVTLHAHLSEIGTIDLWCHNIGTDRQWRLQFDVRSTTQSDMEAHKSQAEIEGYVDDAIWGRCETTLQNVFGTRGTDSPAGLIKAMTTSIGMDRHEWPTSLLRRIWEALMELESGRRRSPAHEARWLNLLGYALRPGYGLAVDDWRVAETWRRVRDKLAHAAASSRTESLILWRRIAGGLSAGQQRALAEPLLSALRSIHRSTTTGRAMKGASSFGVHEAPEIWRLLGSLELLTVTDKVQLGSLICELLLKPKFERSQGPMLWALGRLGQRIPAYGPLNTVVPVREAEEWLQFVVEHDLISADGKLAAMQIGRRTHDRYRDIGEPLRHTLATWLEHHSADTHFITLVREGGQLATEEQAQVFGESLPKGLRLGRTAEG